MGKGKAGGALEMTTACPSFPIIEDCRHHVGHDARGSLHGSRASGPQAAMPLAKESSPRTVPTNQNPSQSWGGSSFLKRYSMDKMRGRRRVKEKQEGSRGTADPMVNGRLVYDTSEFQSLTYPLT